MTNNIQSEFAKMESSRDEFERAQIRRRNIRVAVIAAIVVLLLGILSAVYIAEWGGTNKGPMQPFSSSATTSRTGIA